MANNCCKGRGAVWAAVWAKAWHLAHIFFIKKKGAIFQLNNCLRQVFTFVGRTQPSRKIAARAERNSRTQNERTTGRQDDGNWAMAVAIQWLNSLSVFQCFKVLSACFAIE